MFDYIFSWFLPQIPIFDKYILIILAIFDQYGLILTIFDYFYESI